MAGSTTRSETARAYWERLAERCWLMATGQRVSVVLHVSRSQDPKAASDWWLRASDRVYLSERVLLPVGTDPVTYLASHLAGRALPDHASDAQCAELLTRADPCSLVVLCDAHRLPGYHQLRLGRFLRVWSDTVRSAEARAGGTGVLPCFLAVLSECDGALGDETRLRHVEAWHEPAPLAVTGEWRQVIRARDELHVRLWQSAAFPELAAFDFSLPTEADWTIATTLDTLRKELRLVAEHRRWGGSCGELGVLVQRFPAPGTIVEVRDDMHLRPQYTTLWHEGVLGRVEGRGWDLHAAALVAWRPAADLAYRVWRGQARVVWPLLEHVRHTLQAQMVMEAGGEPFRNVLRRLRGDVPLAEDYPRDPTPLAELSELPRVAQECSLGSEIRFLAAPCADVHRCVRNPLAHGHPVPSASHMRTLVQLIDALGM